MTYFLDNIWQIIGGITAIIAVVYTALSYHRRSKPSIKQTIEGGDYNSQKAGGQSEVEQSIKNGSHNRQDAS